MTHSLTISGRYVTVRLEYGNSIVFAHLNYIVTGACDKAKEIPCEYGSCSGNIAIWEIFMFV